MRVHQTTNTKILKQEISEYHTLAKIIFFTSFLWMKLL